MTVSFSDGLHFFVSCIDMLNMIEVRNLIMAKDRATDCLLYLSDEHVDELAKYLINLPDGTEIEDEIIVELNVGSTGNVAEYEIKIDKNLEFVSFLKEGETKPYKVKKSSCECMAWRFCKGSPKECKHTRMLNMMGIKLKAEPKKIVLTKDERKEWNRVFRKEKITDKNAKNFIIRYSQQLILDYNAMTVAEWHEVYKKVETGNITFTPKEN